MSNTTFSDNKEKISQICERSVKRVLDNKEYVGTQIKAWSEDIIRGILQELGKDEFQPFKYLANCLILSQKSNGVHTITMSLWDPQNDGSQTYQYSGKGLQCIVTVWGLKY